MGSLLPLVAQSFPSAIDRCKYELSDITSFEIKLSYKEGTDSLEWKPTIVYGFDKKPFFEFNTRQTTYKHDKENVIALPPHLNSFLDDGKPPKMRFAFEFDLSKVPGEFALNITTVPPGADKVEDAELKLTGNHYYVPVPGPLPLLGIGVAYSYARKLRKHTSTLNNKR